MTLREMIEEAKRVDAEATKGPWGRGGTKVYDEGGEVPRYSNDAAFIAFARTALPELAGKAEEMAMLIRQLTKSAEDHKDCCEAEEFLRANGYGEER